MSEASLDRPGLQVHDGLTPGGLALLMLVVSLLLHAGIAFYVYDKPLGYVDPASLRETPPPIRVKRASFDEITMGVGASEAAEAAEQMSLADLSQTLLQETEPPGLEEDFEPELQLRDLDETLPASPAGELAVEVPAFDIPQDVLATLSSRNPGELAYRDAEAAGFGAGDGAGGSGSGVGSGSAAATELLRSTGLVTGVRAASPIDRTLPDDRPDLDHNLAHVPLQGPEIDFAGLALAGTTQLDVPEHLDSDFDYVVTRYTDPKNPAEPGYFRVDIAARRSLHKLRTMPKDVVFVVDTSSSVPQEWVTQVAQGVAQAVAALNDGDRFNIVLFDDTPEFFSTAGPVAADPESTARAARFLTGARSEGWTDVNAALSRMLVRDVQTDRAYNLILISDGLPTKGVMDTRELINLITRDNDLTASIYSVGVGRQQNRELLDFLSYRNKGFSVFADDVTHVQPVIRGLASRLRYPLIKNVRLSVAGRGVSEVYPIDLPNIHQGERFSLYGRFDRSGSFTMQITGTSIAPQGGARPVDFTFTRDLNHAALGADAVARDWAFVKLHHLYSEMIRQGETKPLLDQIATLRKRYKLKTLY